MQVTPCPIPRLSPVACQAAVGQILLELYHSRRLPKRSIVSQYVSPAVLSLDTHLVSPVSEPYQKLLPKENVDISFTPAYIHRFMISLDCIAGQCSCTQFNVSAS